MLIGGLMVENSEDFYNGNFFPHYFADVINRLQLIKQRVFSVAEVAKIKDYLIEKAKKAKVDEAILFAFPGLGEKESKVPLYKVINFIYDEKKKPIMSLSGTFFAQHKDSHNKPAQMVNHLLVTRKVEKNAMFKFDEGSLEYDAKDRSQKVYKLMANSWYGALSQSSFIFYNKLLGPAVNLLAAVKLF